MFTYRADSHTFISSSKLWSCSLIRRRVTIYFINNCSFSNEFSREYSWIDLTLEDYKNHFRHKGITFRISYWGLSFKLHCSLHENIDNFINNFVRQTLYHSNKPRQCFNITLYTSTHSTLWLHCKSISK